MGYRDETTKHGQALQAAGQKKLSRRGLQAVKAFLAAEGKMLKGWKRTARLRGAPDVISRSRLPTPNMPRWQAGCEVAGAGRTAGRSEPDDALAPRRRCRTPARQSRPGTFDTLSGNPLQR